MVEDSKDMNWNDLSIAELEKRVHCVSWLWNFWSLVGRKEEGG